MFKRLFCFITILTVLLLSGCSDSSSEQNIGGTTCANITMGNGEFAYYDGMIYFTDYFNLFEYDTESKKLIGFDSNHMRVMNLLVSEDNIYFKSDGINYISKDRRKNSTLFQRDGLCTHTFIAGNIAYFLNGIGGDLISRKIDTGTEVVIDKNVVSYHLVDKKLYYIAKSKNANHLKLYNVDTETIENINLSFEPVTVIAHNNKLYLSSTNSYKMKCVDNGIEVDLPIDAYFFQLTEDKIVFLDENTFENSCYTLKIYDLTTGKIDDIYENVFCFCILDKRYICVHIGTSNEKYAYYDLETKEKILMYNKGTQ